MTDSGPEVSILIPCYNCEKYLAATLETVLAQQFTDWECLLVDDASTDGSREVIRHYAGRDARFRPIFLPSNRGAAGARNAGLAEVRGRYLAFLDSDDLWMEDKLSRQRRHMAETGAALVHSSYRFVDDSGRLRRGGVLASDRVDLRRYMSNTEIGMSTALLDLQQIGTFQFRDIRLCQDTHLWLELLRRGFISRGLPEVLTHYRVRDGQISASKWGMARQVLALYLEIEELSLGERLFRFASYAGNGVRKRVLPPI